jgi:hypothetical protein
VDGTLYVAYVVSKVVPGRRFPVSALRAKRSADGGRTWSQPATVTDDGDFGSHNFHALHAAADGTVYVTWLDGRHGTSAVFLARSPSPGRTRAATTPRTASGRRATGKGPMGLPVVGESRVVVRRGSVKDW